MTTIDIHTHYVPPAYLDWMRREGEPHRRQLLTRPDGRLTILADNREIPLPDLFYDVQPRLAAMAAARVACHVVSPPPFLFHYDLPAAVGDELCQLLNDEALALARRHPGKFVPMGALPLQDVDLSMRELARIAALGFRSLEIGASVNERELDDPALEPFWSEAERLGMLLFIHPVRPPGRARMNDYHLFNLIGFLAETTLACARLIFSGAMDRHPQLKICLAHAGGMLPWISGRFDHGFETIAACRKNIDRPPSAYLSRFYYDSISHGAEQLRFLASAVGAERMLLGSDFPFRIGDPDPVAHLEAAQLGSRQSALILGGNAAELLGLSAASSEAPS
jgi:aminocarboxymuconate-semialdehyde decarboxylase